MAPKEAVKISYHFTTTNTNQVIMDSWPEAAFRSATYTIQMTSNVLAPDSSETSYHTLQLGLLQDGLPGIPNPIW